METSNYNLDDLSKPTEEDISYYKSNVQPVLYQLAAMISQKRPEKEVLGFLGISESKLYQYKKWFPDFRNAFVQGKCSMITRMEHALEQVATGGEYEESEIVNVYEPVTDPNTGEVKMTLVQKKERITKKVAPPNVRAIEMYLTNRDSANWKRSQSDNITQNNTATMINVTEDQMRDFLQTFKNNMFIDTKTTVVKDVTNE